MLLRWILLRLWRLPHARFGHVFGVERDKLHYINYVPTPTEMKEKFGLVHAWNLCFSFDFRIMDYPSLLYCTKCQGHVVLILGVFPLLPTLLLHDPNWSNELIQSWFTLKIVDVARKWYTLLYKFSNLSKASLYVIFQGFNLKSSKFVDHLINWQ